MHTVRHQVLSQKPLELAAKLVVEPHLDYADNSSLASETQKVLDCFIRQHEAPLRSAALRAGDAFHVEVQVGHHRSSFTRRHLAQHIPQVHAHRAQRHIIREKFRILRDIDMAPLHRTRKLSQRDAWLVGPVVLLRGIAPCTR